jgi:hypothetical protein
VTQKTRPTRRNTLPLSPYWTTPTVTAIAIQSNALVPNGLLLNEASTMCGRKRADSNYSASSDSSPQKKGRGERLVSRGRDHVTVGTSFVSGSHEISAALVDKVSHKACRFYITFKGNGGGNEYYHGQGGLLQGERLLPTPPRNTLPRNDVSRPKKFRSLASMLALRPRP